MFFDSSYMMLALFGLVLTGLPQLWVRNTYQKYTKVPVRIGVSGADVARKILAENKEALFSC